MDRAIAAVAGGAFIVPAARALLGEHADIVGDDRLAEASGLYCDDRHPAAIDDAFLDRAPLVRTIATPTAGYQNIDVAACTRRGIAVSTAGTALTEAVADVVFLHVIAAFRRIAEATAWVRDGRWTSGPAPLGDDLAGALLGIVGMGAIGSAVARRARASAMRVVYHNRAPRPDDAATGARYLPFDELLRSAKGIVVTAPLTAETRGMFGAAQFAAMNGAFFINGSRGPIADTTALAAALEARMVAGAALDVTDPEPLPPDHPLLRLPNVFVTPHIGTATVQTRERMCLTAAANLVAGFAGQPLPQIVNPAVYDRA